MSAGRDNSTATAPVQDSVPKVNREIAVGENLSFQQKWWRFEVIARLLFAFIILLDLLGVFGRGFLANATASTSDGALRVKYERVERYGTPSIMRIDFGPGVLKDKHIELWVSDSLVRGLGSQRIIPAPATSSLGGGGILYTFPARLTPASVEFELRPAAAGLHRLSLRIPDAGEKLTMKIFVVP